MRRDLRQSAAAERYAERYMEQGLGDPQAEIPTRLYPPQALASMLGVCDFVALTLPLTVGTQHLIDAAMLEAMKPNAVLINVSRGAIVDEAALITALAAERIAGAALDVFEESRYLAPARCGPGQRDHHAAYCRQHATISRKAAALFSENLRRYLQNEPLLNLYDRDRGY